MMQIADRERAKYEELWSSVSEYRGVFPGLDNVQRFMDVLQPEPHQKLRPLSLIDIGCGVGNAGLAFSDHGFDVSYLDITGVGLLPAVPRQRFIQAALWDRWRPPMALWWDYGFCCDVLEHIPPEFTMLSLHRIMSACRTTWFEIALVPDNCGALIDADLHLTVKPFLWWLERFETLGAHVIDARDLLDSGLYVVRRE
jgi:hypothetical protein